MKIFTATTIFFAIILSQVPCKSQDTLKDYNTHPYWIDMMLDPDANFFETQKAFNTYWENREMTRGNGFKAFKRWEYWMGRQVSPNGTKPSPQRNINALKSLESWNRSSSTIKLNNNSIGNRTILDNGAWTSLGPFNVPSGYDGYRGLGRVNAIGFHPTDPNLIYVGAPAGGLWVTYNGGTNWTCLTDALPTLGISSIIVDYSNPNIVYIGTGDRDHGDAPGTGVWKSMDGGLTFQPSNTGMTTATVGKMVIHPSNPLILIAATNSGLFRSENGGISWTNVSTGNFKDVVLKPGDPNVVYATRNGNFYKSTNNGLFFTQITSGLPTANRGAIAVSLANPSIVYFWLTNSDSFKGLYRSTDGGETFTVRSTTPNIMSWNCSGGTGGQAWYDLDMAADPANADIIYGGGVNCFKSMDGGITWSINSHWWGDCGVPAVHADLHVLEYNPINNRLYTGNDGGVYWTDNGGISWTEISNGLIISQAYKIGQSATNKDFVINGYQDNGTSTYTGSDWTNLNGGDGMECAYDPTDNSYSYSTIYYGDIYRHPNLGYDGQIAGDGVNGITESGAWVTPFLIDHNDGNIMFIGYDNIWRSTNIKAANTGNITWTKISNLNVDNFDQMAQSYANTNILYVADGSNLYRSDNVKAASVTWINLTGSLPLPNTITAIETNPFDENIVYIVLQSHVYKSIDKGQTWNEITLNLPDVQMHTLVCYHNSNEGLYLGTDIGVFYRDAINTQWIQYSNGLPSAAWVTELEIYYDPAGQPFDLLRAGTFGRGLWSSPLINTSPPDPATTITGPISVCQGQTQVQYFVDAIPNATSYVWIVPSGSSGSSNTNSIYVDFSTTAISDEISVFGTNAYGNGAPYTLPISVSALPGNAGLISGPPSVCENQAEVVYSVSEITGATSYLWTLPPGATGSSTTNSITVDFGPAGSGNIIVTGTNDCGSGESAVLEITITPIPADADAISGPNTVCQGDVGITYTVPVIEGATAYSWILPPGANGSSSTNSIVLDFDLTAVTGVISVSGSNSCGNGISSSLNVTVNPLPEAASTITGPEIVCQGDNGVIYTVSEINYATTYTWSLPPGASGTSNTNTIIVSFDTWALNGDITVSGLNDCGTGTASMFPVTVNEKPTTPVVIQNGHDLHSDAPFGNQWYDENGMITGAIFPDYEVTWDGNYYTIVTMDGCSSDPSNILNVIVSAVNSMNEDQSIAVYPNPMTDELIIEKRGNRTNIQFEIYSPTGVNVTKGSMIEKAVINTQHFATGLYFIRLEDGSTIEFRKIVKE